MTKNINVSSQITKKTWKEFQDAGLLWWVNRLLHLCGWVIVFELESKTSNKIIEVYPARCKFRGFNNECETEGFIKLTTHLSKIIRELKKEVLS